MLRILARWTMQFDLVVDDEKAEWLATRCLPRVLEPQLRRKSPETIMPSFSTAAGSLFKKHHLHAVPLGSTHVMRWGSCVAELCDTCLCPGVCLERHTHEFQVPQFEHDSRPLSF